MKKMKSICLCMFTFIMIFVSVAVVFASVSYKFTSVGQSVDEVSSSKLSGNVSLRATHDKYYNGQLAFSLSKKTLLGYSFISRQQVNTYNKTLEVVSWSNCSNANYKGTLLLNVADSNYSQISGTFSFQ